MGAKTVPALAIGDIITDTLSTEQQPTAPQRAYRGVVKRIDPKAQRVIVTLLDEVYEALCEPGLFQTALRTSDDGIQRPFERLLLVGKLPCFLNLR